MVIFTLAPFLFYSFQLPFYRVPRRFQVLWYPDAMICYAEVVPSPDNPLFCCCSTAYLKSLGKNTNGGIAKSKKSKALYMHTA
jgi:hypothetical protein